MSATDIWHDEAERLYAELRGQGHSARGTLEFEISKEQLAQLQNQPRERKPKPIDKAKRRAKSKLQRKARKGNRK